MTIKKINEAEGKSNLSQTTVFRLIASEQRQYLLQYFATRSEAVASLEELLEFIVTKCEEPSIGRDRIWVGLVHHHLPVLTEAGIIEYDARSGYVRYYQDSLLEAYVERC